MINNIGVGDILNALWSKTIELYPHFAEIDDQIIYMHS